MAKSLEHLSLTTLRRMLRATVKAVGQDASSAVVLRRAIAAKRRMTSVGKSTGRGGPEAARKAAAVNAGQGKDAGA